METQDGINDLIRFNSLFLDRLGPIYAVEGQNVRADVSKRVFEDGTASDGSSIGVYSRKPTYVGSSSFLTKKGANSVLGSKRKRKALYEAARSSGKPGAIKFDNAKRPAIYFTEGYKGIRKADGRQTNFVDLNYSGKMRISYQVEVTEDGFILGFTNPLDGAKMRGNEQRFKKPISDLTDQEIISLTEGLTLELMDTFNGLS